MAKRSILSFPSPILIYGIGQWVRKGDPVAFPGPKQIFVSMAPINLKSDDRVWIDSRDAVIQTVERGGIAIYRRAWLN